MACAELYETFTTAANTTDGNAESLRLAAGLALSPALAGQCLLDGPRTSAFVRATLAAIREAARRFAPSTVEVVYAGTGPFAPLALLVIPFLGTLPVRFTLLDANPGAVQSVDALVRAFGCAQSIRAIVCTDATTYRHPSEIHVIVSETMQRTLRDEPFVAILRNLRPQLAAGGIVVPERVTVDLAVFDAASEQARWQGRPPASSPVSHGKVFEVDAAGESPSDDQGATTLTVRHDASAGPQWLGLVTRVLVHKEIVLEPYVSGLTTPEILWHFSPMTRDTTISFQYVTGTVPGMAWTESR